MDLEVKACKRLLPSTTLERVEVIDVGANLGNWTAAAMKLFPMGRFHCFEPAWVAYQQLVKRFGDDDRVSVINLAAGSHTGSASLYTPDFGSGLASFSKRRLDHFGIEMSNVEEVRLDTLDNWCAQNDVTPTLLKIDVEGHELSVLEGAVHTLGSTKVVQFEFGGANIDSRTYFQDFYYFFREHGFDLFRLSPKGLLKVDKYREIDERLSFSNYLATRV